jgi:DNA modification methylase
LFLAGDALAVLKSFPAGCVDFAMTSPPYWGHRTYAGGGIGLEATYREYVGNLLLIFQELKRVLKETGSFWLNIGDTYDKKSMLGIPWRVALAMTDTQGWILRNEVVWNKVKGGPDNATDKLRNILKEHEKKIAFEALDNILHEVREGKLSDFRMIIRGQQRTTHSDSERVSGRARELLERGFYFLKYHPNGAKPGDVWDIIPEDTQKRKAHFAPYPEDLCAMPLLATCPEGGVALDPFCGTGTTNLVAFRLGRRSIGIDQSEEYIRSAEDRCRLLL